MDKILPSILGVDDVQAFLDTLTNLNKQKISNIQEIHVDIMDGIFVENRHEKLDDIKIVKNNGYIADVHLMVQNPKQEIEYAVKLGADNITIHYEIDKFKYFLNLLIKLKKEIKINIGVSVSPRNGYIAFKTIYR